MVKRCALVLLLAINVAGCGSINSFLAEKIGNNLPAWAGGLPNDAPPRQGEPGYGKYERELKGIAETSTGYDTHSTPKLVAPKAAD